MEQKFCSAGQILDKLLNECINVETQTGGRKICSTGHQLFNRCISIKTKTEAKKSCSAGQKWDELIKNCIPSNTDTRLKPDHIAESPRQVEINHVRVRAPTPQADPIMMLSPALWIFVVLGTVGSIMALVLWFMIYRRESRHCSTSDDAESGPQPLQKAEPLATINPLTSDSNGHAQMCQGTAEAPSSSTHLHSVDQTGSKWEDGVIAYKSPANDAGKEGGIGQTTCSIMREHKIPLPATELGGTALVTTKTV
ncbi:uncharacterized protein LOC115047650 [Echeneis naucrates]|uniref:Uncharacterized LOC115047650 n=1 Tax=Echeneis naucrates TaxID=173247 RepID=A0A665WAV0_ECHNA|nr:uncharacterized protein LOC115047650 [Echeneis naucrates]